MPKRTKKVQPKTDGAIDQLLKRGGLVNTPKRESASSRRSKFRAAKTAVTLGLNYLLDNAGSLRGNFKKYKSVRGAEDALRKRILELDAGIKAAKARIEANRQRANRAIAPVPGGHAGDGNCYVRFVNVGSGDCTLVTTPAGVRIMIDCGSDSLQDVLDPTVDYTVTPWTKASAETYIQNAITSQYFLNGSTTIDLLFLTHPDKDHHNKVKTLLEPLNVTFGYIYYGGTDNFNGTYAHGTSGYLTQVAGAAKLRKVTLREEAAKSGGSVVVTRAINGIAVRAGGGQANTLGDEWEDATGAIVAYYETTNGSNFRISLLAGNVIGVWNDDESEFLKRETKVKLGPEAKGNATRPNRRSLIVLVECYGRSVVVCGDATAVTEKFVLKQFDGSLPRQQLLRIGHHGSETSSLAAFVARINPGVAVLSSSGRLTRKHFLPKQKIVKLYAARVPQTAGAHTLYAFKVNDQRSHKYFKNTTRELWATGSNGTQGINILKP